MALIRKSKNYSKRHAALITPKRQLRPLSAAAFSLLFAGIGVTALAAAYASTGNFSVSLNPQLGSLAGSAKVVSSGAAIGSQAVQFNPSWSSTTPAPSLAPSGPSPYVPIPARVAGAYWTNWDPLTLANTSKSYNMLWVFAATSTGTSGAVSFGAPISEPMAQLKTDIQARRAAGTCVMLTVGGEGASFYLTNQAQATAFVNSIYSIYAQLGGFDGIDWDIENTSMINSTQLVWIGQQLKAHYGQSFHITWAAADPSWIANGPSAVAAMVQGGSLDAVDVMGYDFGQSSESAKISAVESYVNSWVSTTGSASRVIIGIQLPNADDGATNTFGSYTSDITLWDWAHSTYPTIRGMDIWTAYEDARSNGGSGGTFVSQVIPAVLK